MSKFRTQISNSTYPYDFHHEQAVFCIGSCFAEHIGMKLKQAKFLTLLNPSGILYNPFSIARTIEQLINQKKFTETDIFEFGDQWHSFDHHGHFSDSNQVSMLKRINDQIIQGHHFLKKTKRLILTFGTSNVFVHKNTQKIVSNCHKVPNYEFDREALSIEKITEALDPLFKQLKNINPDLEVLLTVSPVRHIRDGLVENKKSKARLLVACELLEKANEFVHYFPSYEIMMDDLRDYRFYKKDMIHPNEVAIDYIWNYFDQCFFSETTRSLNSKISKIISAIQHRPFNPESPDHQKFIVNQLNTIERIQSDFSFLNFNEEHKKLKEQLL